jgi:uncharacterized cupredoxin-like copper-binding protein
MQYRMSAAGLILIFTAVLAAGPAESAPRPPGVAIVAGPPNEFTFQPNQVTVQAGQPVTITLVNKGKLDHDLFIEALGVKLPPMGKNPKDHPMLAPSKSVTLTFTPAKKGTFEFICTVPGHKEAGMKGVIVVK